MISKGRKGLTGGKTGDTAGGYTEGSAGGHSSRETGGETGTRSELKLDPVKTSSMVLKMSFTVCPLTALYHAVHGADMSPPALPAVVLVSSAVHGAENVSLDEQCPCPPCPPPPSLHRLTRKD